MLKNNLKIMEKYLESEEIMNKIRSYSISEGALMRLFSILWLVLLPSTALAAGPPSSSESPQATRFSAAQAPNFAAMTDVRLKKRSFFEYLAPFVITANNAVRAERSFLLNAESKLIAGDALTRLEADRVRSIADHYRRRGSAMTMINIDSISELLTRVDTIPLSLALAQAANESGWGTSRFARKANNYFGIWCYQSGCGLKPAQREPGLTHEVKKFADVGDNIADYLHNINTNPAYSTLRDLRATLRDANAPLRGVLLAEGLLAYSSRGAAYVQAIQQLIISNELEQQSLHLAALARR